MQSKEVAMEKIIVMTENNVAFSATTPDQRNGMRSMVVINWHVVPV